MTLFKATFLELILPFFLTFGVMSCILIMEKVYHLVSLIVEKQFGAAEVGLMLFYLMPQVLAITIPLGVVGAVFITVIRQSIDSELVCMRASGRNLWSYCLPILLFGLIATAVTAADTLWASPYLYQKYADLQAEIIKTHADEKLVPGKFNYDFGDKAIQIGGRGKDKTLSEIFIADRVLTPTSSTIVADLGRIEVDEESKLVFFRLRNGSVYAPTENQETFRKVDFASLDYRLEFDPQGSPETQRVKREPTLAIVRRLRSADSGGHMRNRWLIELGSRLTLPWSCLIFALASVPMAIVDPRSGRSGSFLRAVFLVITYYIVWIAFKDLVKGGNAPAGVLAIPLLLVLAYGMLRLWQLDSDIRLFRMPFRG